MMMPRTLIWIALALAGMVDTGPLGPPDPLGPQEAQLPPEPQGPEAPGVQAPADQEAAPREPAGSGGALAAKPAPAPLVGLNQIFADPLAYLGRRVRIVFQVHSAPEQWNPYLTRFGTRDWAAVRVWAEHQFLWDVREYEHPLGLIFASRDSAAHAALEPAQEFSRFEATVRVDQVFLGRPWIAILDLVPLRAETGRGSILHASRALHLMANGEWRLAMDDISRASVSELPEAAQAELDRLTEFCEQRLAEIRARNRSQR